jgi:hypothetical protein
MEGDLLQDALDRLRKAKEANEKRRQEIINEEATGGVKISPETALKYVLALKSTYNGPDQEEYIREIDQFANDFRQKHGPQIPIDKAYAILKELEGKHGRVGSCE